MNLRKAQRSVASRGIVVGLVNDGEDGRVWSEASEGDLVIDLGFGALCTAVVGHFTDIVGSGDASGE